MSNPVVLVHGFGTSSDRTWRDNGWIDLLQDAGREVVAIDLLGHGRADKPHDPAAYAELEAHVAAQLPDAPVDGVGFSLGAITLLAAAAAWPERFRRLVLAGVGRNVFEHDDEATRRIIDAIEGTADEPDNRARLFAQYAAQPGNDPVALAAALRGARPRFDEGRLARVTCPVLVAVGDEDFVLPADRLMAALPDATFASLRRTDHFATPESFEFVDAALEFLDAVPC